MALKESAIDIHIYYQFFIYRHIFLLLLYPRHCANSKHSQWKRQYTTALERARRQESATDVDETGVHDTVCACLHLSPSPLSLSFVLSLSHSLFPSIYLSFSSWVSTLHAMFRFSDKAPTNKIYRRASSEQRFFWRWFCFCFVLSCNLRRC